MKKLLLVLVAVLGLATLFSSCQKEAAVVYGNYTISLQNDSSYTVTEWHPVNAITESVWSYNDKNSPYYTIKPGETKGMSNITGGQYYYVTYKVDGKWSNSSNFFLDSDKTLRLVNKQLVEVNENAPAGTKAVSAAAVEGITE